MKDEKLKGIKERKTEVLRKETKEEEHEMNTKT